MATSADSRALLAGETKRLRLERGMSLHRLSAMTGYSRPHVREVERVDARVPSATVVAAVDKALEAGGHLSALRERAYAELQRRREEEREQALEAPTLIDSASLTDPEPAFTDLAVTLLGGSTYSEANDMQRRTFLGLGGTAALGLAGSHLALEAARHGLTLAFAEERADAAVDDWQEVINEHGFTYQKSAPAELLDSLIVDVLGVQYAMSRDPDDATRRELRRVAGLLASFMAMTVANLGHTREARRWWRTARRAADESGDVEASLWIRGREVVRAPYEGCPLPTVLDLAEQAESRVTRSARSVLPQLYAGKAQSLALAGRQTDAVGALEQARDAFADLPSQTANDQESLFGWAEERLRFTEGFVFSRLGDVDRADVAQRRALALYPASYPRGPAQIELQRAFSLVRSGDVAKGSRHVLDTMTRLPREHHVRPVVDLSHKVLQAVPASEHHRSAVRELREYLTGHNV